MKKMKFTRLTAIFIWLISVVAANAQDEKLIRVETNLVSVNVAVTDKQGNFVKGLRQERFQIFDDGVRQQIAHFSDAESAVAFGVVLDLRPVKSERRAIILDALRLFARKLPAKDDFFVLAFDERGSFIFDFVPTEEQIQAQLSDASREPNSLYDAIRLAAEKVAEKKNAKHALLVVSDGADGNSRMDFDKLQKRLREFDTQIYAVVFDKTGNEPVLLDVIRQRKLRVNILKEATPLDRAALEDLTKTSGGMYHASLMKNSLEIYEMLKHGANDARQKYSIGFYPTSADGKWHKIKIKILPDSDGRGWLFASYRRGYQSPAKSSDK